MICIVLWLFFLGAYAQSDSIRVDTIRIESTAFSSIRQVVLDRSSSSNLAESIQQSEAIYVKNYGGLSLATLSIRGSSASQTGIYWNNLSISNSMLGLLDLSIIPSSFMEKSTIVYGSESTNFGSGNIGGGLYLENSPTNEISLSTSIGSFGNYGNSAIISVGKKIKTSVKLQYQTIENDYPYTLANGETKSLINGEGSQFNGMLNSSFNLGKNNFSVNYWYTQAKRNIPYTTRQTNGNDSTKDFNSRLNINYNRKINSGIVEWNTGLFINNNQFYQTELVNKNIDQTISNRITYKVLENNFSYTLGLDQSYVTGRSGNYEANETQQRVAVFANASHRNKIVNIDLRARQELVDLSFAPFIPEISLSQKIGILRAGIKINRIYRKPTLNDLYRRPGGNTELLAENGWSKETFTEIKYRRNKYQLEGMLTGYDRTVSNWIIWTLTPDSPFFSPRNINQVRSRGLEFSFNQRLKINSNAQFRNDFNYNMNISTFQEAQEFPKKEIGDQLLYTPVHQLNNKTVLTYKNISAFFVIRNFSSTEGINASIDSYTVGDLQLSYLMKIKKGNFKLNFSINNIWNKSYRIIEFRPMPGRNYLLNMTYKLN